LSPLHRDRRSWRNSFQTASLSGKVIVSGVLLSMIAIIIQTRFASSAWAAARRYGYDVPDVFLILIIDNLVTQHVYHAIVRRTESCLTLVRAALRRCISYSHVVCK